jgi:hypothetical protein
MDTIVELVHQKAVKKAFTNVLKDICKPQIKHVCLDKVPARMTWDLYYSVYFMDANVTMCDGEYWMDVSRFDRMERKRLYYELCKKNTYNVSMYRLDGACFLRIACPWVERSRRMVTTDPTLYSPEADLRISISAPTNDAQ